MLYIANLYVMGTVHAKLVLYSLDLLAFHAQKRGGLRNDREGGGARGHDPSFEINLAS